MSQGPATAYAIVHQGVAQILADLADGDIETVGYQIARSALMHVRAAKGNDAAETKASDLQREFAADGGLR